MPAILNLCSATSRYVRSKRSVRVGCNPCVLNRQRTFFFKGMNERADNTAFRRSLLIPVCIQPRSAGRHLSFRICVVVGAGMRAERDSLRSTLLKDIVCPVRSGLLDG